MPIILDGVKVNAMNTTVTRRELALIAIIQHTSERISPNMIVFPSGLSWNFPAIAAPTMFPTVYELINSP